jgi:SAM-dependent methyltransferase
MALWGPVPVPDVVAYVRAALPPPPARVLEIGAGDGSLARALREAGYDVTAVDPMAEPDSGVEPIPLHAVDAPPRHFDAAAAVVSLHHVVPLGESLRRLSEVMRHGARLVVDEMDLDAYDARAAVWWLGHSKLDKQPQDMLAELQEHIIPVSRIREELAAWFDISEPIPGPYLYRWKIDPALRGEEEQLIARGAIPAVGKRFVAVRR